MSWVRSQRQVSHSIYQCDTVVLQCRKAVAVCMWDHKHVSACSVMEDEFRRASMAITKFVSLDSPLRFMDYHLLMMMTLLRPTTNNKSPLMYCTNTDGMKGRRQFMRCAELSASPALAQSRTVTFARAEQRSCCRHRRRHLPLSNLRATPTEGSLADAQQHCHCCYVRR